MAQKEDRRVRKTKEALRNGLLQLMQEKQINEITVKELTELVDINRYFITTIMIFMICFPPLKKKCMKKYKDSGSLYTK